jgi:alkaline phosphatase D
MVGDQMYADAPKRTSLFDATHFERVAPQGRQRLFDCSVEEIRALYQQRYRHFWNVPAWRDLQAEHPCYMIWDDHDIVDNWGSDAAHQQPPWSRIGEGARRACYDYQASRTLDAVAARDHFAYTIEYGCIAIHVMDLRSQRRAGDNGRLIGDAQHDDVARFLRLHADKPVVFIVLSVPAVHLPKTLSHMCAWLSPWNEDFSDRWSTGEHVHDRDRLLRALRDHQRRHPAQRVVLLSGDIHIGCLHELSWDDGRPNLYQFISSGITHDTSRFVQSLSSLIMRAKRKVTAPASPDLYVRLLRGDGPARDNPCGRLNFGIVEFERRPGQQSTSMRFYLYTHDGDEPLCQYRSPDVLA